MFCALRWWSSTQERRWARRELKTLAKSEAASDEQQARRMAELQLKEQEEALNTKPSETPQVTRICAGFSHGVPKPRLCAVQYRS